MYHQFWRFPFFAVAVVIALALVEWAISGEQLCLPYASHTQWTYFSVVGGWLAEVVLQWWSVRYCIGEGVQKTTFQYR